MAQYNTRFVHPLRLRHEPVELRPLRRRKSSGGRGAKDGSPHVRRLSWIDMVEKSGLPQTAQHLRVPLI
jgi:hypothetical protein